MAGNAVFKKILSSGEEQVSRLASQLIGNEHFVASLQKVVTSTLSAKGALDKQVAAAMTAMHVPTTPDVQKLNDRLDELERIFEGLNSKVDAIAAKFDIK